MPMATAPSTFPFPVFPSATTYPPPPYSFPAPISSTVPMHATTTHLPPHPYGFGAPPYAPDHHSAAAYAPPPGFFPTPAYCPPSLPSVATYHHPFPFTNPAFPYAAGPHQPNPVHLPYPQIHTPPPTVSSATQSSPPTSAFFSYPVPMSGSSPVPACGYYTAPAAYTSPYSQVHAPPLESTAPPTPAPPITEAPGSTPTSAQPWAASSPSPGLDSVRAFQPLAAETATTTPVRRPDQVPGAPLPTDLCSPTPWSSQVVADERVSAKDATLHRLQQQEHGQPSFHTIQGQLAKLTTMVSQFAVSAGKQSTRATPSSSPLQGIGNAPVTPKVFDAMPTPSTSQGTHGSVPEYHSGHHTPIRSTLLDGNSNLREQNMDRMPQAYGLHNLNRQSVFLGDGTEHSYYALPENYPIARATTKQMSAVYGDKTESDSNESVGVFVSNPGQQPYEEEKQEGDQLRKCLSKALESEHTSACLNIITDVRDFTLELHQQDNEKAWVDVQQLRAPPLNVLVIDETRNEWDPGAILSSTRNKDISAEILYPHILSSSFIQKYCSMKCNSWLNILLQSMSDQVKGLNPLSLTTPWDPGVLVMHSGITSNSTRTTRDVEWNTLQSLGYMLAIVTSPLSNLAVSYFTNHMLLVLSASCREIMEDCFANKELMANTSGNVAALTWHNSITGTPFQLPNNINYTWDPGVLKLKDTILDICPVPHQVQFVQHSAELSLLSLEFSINSRKKVQWDPGVKICFYSWLDILTVWSEIDKPLSSTHIPDLAVWRNQSVDSGASYIWDPGTMLLWYNSNWWLLYTEENTNCHKDIKCYGVALWLIHFQPP